LSTLLGNSGRGTDGPAPLMTEEERLKSDVASRGYHEPHPQVGAGSDYRPAGERRASRAQTGESGSEQTDQQRGGGPWRLRRLWKRMRGWVEPTEPQPGGGHWSESEKPDSPESRWGGGR
jgi:hypothetical protein